MAFQKGRSGNPRGRPRGSVSQRIQLAKLLEPHAEALVTKIIELALSGDTNALRLCIERLIPKVQREPACIDLPSNLNTEDSSKLKDAVLCAALNGQISAGDADKLTQLINARCGEAPSQIPSSLSTNDPIEAAKIYRRIMMEN